MIGGLQLFLNRNKQIQKICEYVKQHVKPVKTIKTTFCLSELVNVSNVKFVQTVGCPLLTWESKEHGLCEVDLSVSFFQYDNSTVNVTIPVANKTFNDCGVTMNATGISYNTVVYLTYENGNRVKISEDDNKENIIYKALQTTTHHHQQQQQQQQQQLQHQQQQKVNF